MTSPSTKVGIVGYGHLGRYLVDQILTRGDEMGLELCFVWNRSRSVELLERVGSQRHLKCLDEFESFCPDLIVEVASPAISREYGTKFLSRANYLIGSPSALADVHLLDRLTAAASDFSLLVPNGALWGGEDIGKMDRLATLRALTVTMTFHPDSLKLAEGSSLKVANDRVQGDPVTLYDGERR